MGLFIQKTSYRIPGKKKTFVLGLFIWLIALLLSMVIMGLLGIQPENTSEPWGINHPKYFQFELLMIPTMVLLMFGFAYVFYTQCHLNTVLPMDIFTDGLIIMAIQFILDFIVFVVLTNSGLKYFYGLVTVGYLTIPIQWYLFVKILLIVKGES